MITMKTLNESLLCFQSKSVAVHKNAKADRYKYADLPAVLEAVADHGIALLGLTMEVLEHQDKDLLVE